MDAAALVHTPVLQSNHAPSHLQAGLRLRLWSCMCLSAGGRGGGGGGGAPQRLHGQGRDLLCAERICPYQHQQVAVWHRLEGRHEHSGQQATPAVEQAASQARPAAG